MAGRWAWAVVLLACCSAVTSAAGQALPSSAAAATSPHRSLLQDALSNSDGCITSGAIPKCEAGACVARNIMGVAKWTCARCLANYQPVVDASGQDNIVQCVCPRGSYEAGANATSCTKCDKNFFCPGGDQVENPASRGSLVACGTQLVTRTTGARSQLDCVAPAGYAQTSPTTATPCGQSEYAPMFNRLAKCLKCQSGLEEPPASNLTVGQRASKRAVCRVPPGRYMSQGLVRWCPQGFYRANYEMYDAAVAQLCLACRPGITTAGAAARSAAECSVVLPGYGIGVVLNVTGPQSIPPLPQNSSDGLPNATLCNIGFYSVGGYCAQCPGGAVTRAMGSTAIEQCLVPPGYITANGSLAQCGSGSFRADWLMFSDPRAARCTPCGTGIQSEPRDLDEHPLAANGSLVASSSASCFILAGQGMIASGKNIFSATDCPANTYGAAGKVYGWAAAPCKPCPRNMITDGLTNVNSSDVCINPDGFGYASEGASKCAPGFYALKGSRKPCQRCPYGRTTSDNSTQQRLFTDCFVKPGFGLVSSTVPTSDGSGFIADTSGLTDEQAAVVPVLDCPVGYYGAGNTLRALCVKCPNGSSTEDVGATSASLCSVCLAGYGQQNGSTACTPCGFGSFQPGDSTTCTACPRATFYAPVDGAGPTWTSAGTTLFVGAMGEQFCVTQQSQLSPDAGQAYFASALLPYLTVSVPAGDLPTCLAVCPPTMGCMVQWDAAAQVCYYAALAYDTSSSPGIKLEYKLPPSTLGSASSLKGNSTHNNNTSNTPLVKAKSIASGFYARVAVPAASQAAWLQAGVSLDADRAQNFKWGTPGMWDQGKSEADCQRKCDDSIVCFGFFYDVDAQACLYRGGMDALRTRSFFVMPNMLALVNGSTPV